MCYVIVNSSPPNANAKKNTNLNSKRRNWTKIKLMKQEKMNEEMNSYLGKNIKNNWQNSFLDTKIRNLQDSVVRHGKNICLKKAQLNLQKSKMILPRLILNETETLLLTLQFFFQDFIYLDVARDLLFISSKIWSSFDQERY